MTVDDFAHQMLTPNGKQQLTNLGAYMAAQLGDPCSLAVTLVADDSARDLQSADYFASGFLPPACSGVPVRVCNTTETEAIGSSNAAAVQCAGPDEAEVRELFGANFDALTELYRPQMQQLGEITGCCSAEARVRLSPTTPIASPAARPLRPHANPPPKCAIAENCPYAGRPPSTP